jgi:hypothetical protein
MATNNAINLSAAGVPTYDGAGTFSASTLTQHAILLGGASNLINSSLLTNGQLLIGNTGNDPTAAQLTAGTGVSIVNGTGSITINAAGGGLTWTQVTGTSQAGAVNNGYIANNIGLVTITLPAVSPIGSIIAVTGINNPTGWKIAQNAGNVINFGTATTTAGATGFLASTHTFDTVYLVCVTTNAQWVVTGSIGNITVF